MTIRFLALPWALSCGGALAAPASVPDPAPPPSITIPRGPSPLNGLPPPGDPRRADWRASNQTVFRLGGHVGHWRGTLTDPAPERKP